MFKETLCFLLLYKCLTHVTMLNSIRVCSGRRLNTCHQVPVATSKEDFILSGIIVCPGSHHGNPKLHPANQTGVLQLSCHKDEYKFYRFIVGNKIIYHWFI